MIHLAKRLSVQLAVLISSLFLITITAHAAGASLTWTAPTLNTDGTSISGSLTYNIYRGTSVTTLTKLASSSTLSYTDATAPIGTNYYAVTAVNSAGSESAKSAIVSKVIAAPVPAAPTGLTVSSTTAYTIVQQTNKLVALPVGQIPADTTCDVSQSVNGMYVVDRAKVTWTGNVKPLVVVAQCAG